jgi:hypothetical protein
MTHSPTSALQNEPKLWLAIKYGIDALFIVVPLLGMTYFLFDPEAYARSLATTSVQGRSTRFARVNGHFGAQAGSRRGAQS